MQRLDYSTNCSPLGAVAGVAIDTLLPGAYLRIVGVALGTPNGALTLGGRPEFVVFRQVGTAFVVPTDGQLYVPTDGAVTVPYPAVPAAWASAAVFESAMAAASATVASFITVFFLVVFRERCGGSIDRLQRTFSSRLFNLARPVGSFLRFTGIEPIITRKTARQKNRRASLSVLECPARNRRRRTNKIYNRVRMPAA